MQQIKLYTTNTRVLSSSAGMVPHNPSEIPPNQNVTKFVSSLNIIHYKYLVSTKGFSFESGSSQDFSQDHQTFQKVGENLA